MCGGRFMGDWRENIKIILSYLVMFPLIPRKTLIGQPPPTQPSTARLAHPRQAWQGTQMIEYK